MTSISVWQGNVQFTPKEPLKFRTVVLIKKISLFDTSNNRYCHKRGLQKYGFKESGVTPLVVYPEQIST